MSAKLDRQPPIYTFLNPRPSRTERRVLRGNHWVRPQHDAEAARLRAWMRGEQKARAL